MAVLSIGQMWAAVSGSVASSIAAGDQVVLINTSGNAELTGVNSSNVGTQAAYTSAPAGTCILTVEAGKYGSGTFSFRMSDGMYLAYTSSATSKNNNLWAVTLDASPTDDQKKQVSWYISFNESSEVTINNVYNTGRNLRYNSQSGQERFCCYTSTQTAVKFFKLSASSTPTVSADPEEVEVDAEAHASQSLALTYENWGTVTVDEVEATLWNDAACTETFDGGWISNVAVAAGNASVSFDIAANAGAARAAYLKIYALGDDASTEAETVVSISQVKYSAPTGTFELLTGDLAEGDYVITHASANAIKAEINSDRFAAIEVSPSANIIINPDESIVWHIAQSGGYWTIYNVAADKYAASTGAKNKGALLDDGTDDKALWSLSGTYDFINKQNTANSVNATLRYNYQNALNTSWACYASGTGSALVLYKKQVAGQPKAPTFSVPGGNYENAQSVELSCETQGATIYYTTNGDAPTSSSTQYNGTAIAVDHTMTIKAIAIKNEISSTVASATYTIIVWQTVADVWDDITADGPTNAHIYGYVSQINVGGFDNNFYISDNGSTEGNQLYAYRMNMNSFSVAVGDKVKLAGDLTEYQGTKEFKYANSGATQGLVVALEAKGALQSVAVSGTPTKTEYASGEDFDPAGLKVFGTYANGFVGEITEGITWGNDLTDNKVTENTTVHVTATVSGQTSPAYDVPVTVAAKTLVSIAVGTASYTIYTGEVLPKPVVTATFSEGDPEDVSTFAVYDTESVFDTEVIDDPDPQTITVSYTFGGATEIVTYTVSVKDYANADNAPYSVTEALHIITAAIGNTESAREIVVTGTVSEENISNNKNRYKISDSTNELLVYAGKGFNNGNFTNTNYPKVGDVVKVKGKVINYNNNTPEFASGKSYLLSQVRPATIAIENVASFEVGATDLTESDLDITTPSDGDITFVSGDDAVATIEANAIHAVAPGTVTITANLAATENVDALNYAATSTPFSVTVVAPATKYAITFDGNGADGGSAPDAIADKAAGAEVTLPANSFTYAGHLFAGWKVFNDDTSEEIEVNAGAFEMPASTVTIQAQWVVGSAVTFIAGTDKSDETSITKDGITISATTFNNDSYYQCYSGDAMTVSSAVGNIIKIELTCTTEGTAKYGPGNWDFTGYSYSGSNGSWEGSAETVEFGNASQQVRMTQITVYYSPDSRAAAGLAWDPADDIELIVGDAFTAPTLLNPNSIDAAEISIASSNTDVATVTAGVVALVADATGEATITATFAGNASYKPATVSYKITVSEMNVTFDATVDVAESDVLSISKEGFTLAFTSGALDNSSEYRLYKGQTMTLSSTDYLITKIEFTCTSGNPITGFADATGLDKDNNEWTGESNIVELTASNNQVRIEKLKVYYVEDIRAASGLAWSTDEVEITLGDDFTAASLVNPNNIDAAEISIESSNTDLAIVNNGAVELVVDATGTATITATFAGNATYKPAEFSYTITVNDPTPMIITNPTTYLNFGSVAQNALVNAKNLEVTLQNVAAATVSITGDGASAFSVDQDALTANATLHVSASSANQGTFSATLTISDDANGAESKEISLSLTVTEPVVEETAVSTTSKWIAATDADLVDGAEVLITGVKDEVTYAMGIQNTNNRAAVEASVDGEGILTPGEGTMSFILEDQGDGTFALRTSNGKYLYAAASGSNHLKTQAEVDVNAKWTISASSAVAESSNNRNIMRFNTTSVIFSCYSSGQVAIAFYVPKPVTPPTPDYTEVRNGLNAGEYYTMCLDKAVTAVQGGIIWRVLSKAQSTSDIILEEVELPLEAGRPYIFFATASTLQVAYTGDAVLAPVTDDDNNGLVGSFSQAHIDNVNTNYIIYNNELYYVNTDNVYVGEHRAYLDMTGVPPYSNEPQQGNAPRRRVTMAVHGPQVATGMDALNASDAPVKVLINGQLFILRGEKMFDAKGQLVK